MSGSNSVGEDDSGLNSMVKKSPKTKNPLTPDPSPRKAGARGDVSNIAPHTPISLAMKVARSSFFEQH